MNEWCTDKTEFTISISELLATLNAYLVEDETLTFKYGDLVKNFYLGPKESSPGARTPYTLKVTGFPDVQDDLTSTIV